MTAPRRHALGFLMAGVLCAWQLAAAPLAISYSYRSPRNPERKIRASTQLIVLHTTEAPARSSLNKLSDRGEAHYCVTESGSIYAIVDRDREAFHAGRSMWRGQEDVDKFSIGIECVGYHDKPMPTVQLAAIRDLVTALKTAYRLPDHCVVCHSHVAYGAPNKWHRFRHRGRKRCGMLFAMPSVRRFLGLKTRPGGDVDVAAGRLRNADDYLTRVLYGRVDTMAGRIGGAAPQPKPSGLSGLISGIVNLYRSKPAPARVAVSKPPVPKVVVKSARAAVKAATVPKTVAQLKAGGWKLRGKISKTQTALKLVGPKWSSADTYYVIRGKLQPGNRIDAAHFEVGMEVWTK